MTAFYIVIQILNINICVNLSTHRSEGNATVRLMGIHGLTINIILM